MPVRSDFIRAATAVLLCASLSGCLPSGQGQFEEEKESHYVAGRNCVSGMDYEGGIEQFEKAVEVNPRNASAHFQLGCLYEEKQPDPAAAIYHYEKFLKLRPSADNAEVVRQHINNCKQDLAKVVLPLPIPPGMQREFEQLAEENKRLREENEGLKASLAQLASTNRPGQASARPVSNPALAASGNSSRPVTAGGGGPATAANRTHVIKQGETLISVARKYGVKLDALLKANPGVDPKRLAVGKSLNIP